MNRFIVAEISKNWIDGQPACRGPFINELFEQVIEVNRQRGYRLHSFQLHRIMQSPRTMNETVLAVFEREEGTPP